MKEGRRAVSNSRFDQELSRRRLLKILAASGGAVAATAVLPGSWMKPVVELGVLPAHAQLSVTGVEITRLTVGRGSIEGTATCEDLNGNIDGDSSRLWVRAHGRSCEPNPFTLIDGWSFNSFDWDSNPANSMATVHFSQSTSPPPSSTEGCDECDNLKIEARFESGGVMSPWIAAKLTEPCEE